MITQIKEDKCGHLYIEIPATFIEEDHIVAMKVVGKGKKKRLELKDIGVGIKVVIFYGPLWDTTMMQLLGEWVAEKLNKKWFFFSTETWQELENIAERRQIPVEDAFMNLLHNNPKEFLTVVRRT